jgi:hypothetical protein
MQRALSLEETPALSVALRFILAAPWFAAAAGALLLWYGPAALQTRWSPVTIALTHLMTLGYLAMTMAGAMLQMLPVVAGFAVPRARMVAAVAFAGLAAGTPALVAALLTGQPFLFGAAALSLAVALAAFAGAAAAALARRSIAGALPMVAGMRLAVTGLAAAAVLGLTLAGYFAGAWVVPALLLADLHAASGLLGWVAMLVFAVALQVIPMFQATNPYPRKLGLALPAVLGLLLVAWGAGAATGARWQGLAAVALAAPLAAFAAFSLYLLASRKRRAHDVTTLYWFLSLGSLLACVVLYLWPQAGAVARSRELLLGILFIAGFAGSAVNGMLYKIVPFLLWYHLAQAGLPRGSVPGVNAWISQRAARWQFCCHAAALAALAAAPIVPALARPAGLLFVLAMAWQGAMLMRCALRYRRLRAGSGAERA